jgi:hypothetical protein
MKLSGINIHILYIEQNGIGFAFAPRIPAKGLHTGYFLMWFNVAGKTFPALRPGPPYGLLFNVARIERSGMRESLA